MFDGGRRGVPAAGHQLTAASGRVCRQSLVNNTQHLANEPRIMQVWSVSPGGLICERRHWRLALAVDDVDERDLAYGPSVLG